MPLISKPQFTELLARSWTKVSAATGLTADHSSAIGYNIIGAFCQELLNLWDQLEYAESQSNISTAVGSNLDSIGEFFGVVRRTSTSATTVGTPNAVKFTNSGLVAASVPGGTRIWATDAPDRAYFTTLNLLISPGSQGYTDVTAAGEGVYYNTAANTLVNHSLADTNITVTNELPIVTGRDIETDENYRVRISREILRKEGANLTAVREALLEVPGVRDVLITNMARGTGTLDALIYGYDREVPSAVIDVCQRVLEETVAAGISAVARAPITKSVDVTVKLTLKSSAIFSQVRSMVSAAIRGYIDNLPIEDGTGNGTLVFAELAARVQEASEDIVDSSVSMSVDNIPALKSNQTSSTGERFISRVINIS